MKELLTILLSLFIIGNLFSQDAEPAKWSYEIENKTEGNIEITLIADIESNWYIYAMNLPDGGPLPLFIAFDESDKLEFEEEFNSVKEAKELFDEVFKMNVAYYEGKTVFKAVIKETTNENLKLIIDGQACYKVDGSCIQIFEEMILTIKPIID